jgi:thioredoxin 1
MNRILLILPIAIIFVIAGFLFLSEEASKPVSLSYGSGDIITITDNNFSHEVLDANIPVVVDFWATWCAPCRKLSPIMDELSEQYKGSIKFGKLDVDQNPSMTAKYNIDAIPHLIIFNKGKVVNDIVGLHPKSDIEAALNKVAEK